MLVLFTLSALVYAGIQNAINVPLSKTEQSLLATKGITNTSYKNLEKVDDKCSFNLYQEDAINLRMSFDCSDMSEEEIRTEAEGIVISSARHKEALDQAIKEGEKALNAAKTKKSAEFIAHHLNCAQDMLGRITGRVTTDAVLDEIFLRFCIGK